jgi:hypothetical protein
MNYYAALNDVEETEETSIFTAIESPISVKATYVETRYVVVKFYVQLTDGTTVLADTQYVKPGEDAVDPATSCRQKTDIH